MPESRTESSPDARPLVVCIDDDAVVEPVFRAAAERAGARALFVGRPEQFRQALLEMSPAGAVLDQVMPESTGAELVMWMRSLPKPPAVIVIGSDPLYLQSSAILVQRAGLELAGSLQKPLDLKEFARIISDLIGRRSA